MNFKFTIKLLKVVAVVFVVLSLFVTFTQEAFKDEVSANFLLMKTPEFPIYAFILMAFVVGLFIGLFTAAVDHWEMARYQRDINKENDTLLAENQRLEKEMAACQELREKAEAESVKVEESEKDSSAEEAENS